MKAPEDIQPENFGALPPIPGGWSVHLVEPYGDHFIVCDPAGEQRSCIHWNRYTVRRWAFALAEEEQLRRLIEETKLTLKMDSYKAKE